jgi:hypothetical protein
MPTTCSAEILDCFLNFHSDQKNLSGLAFNIKYLKSRISATKDGVLHQFHGEKYMPVIQEDKQHTLLNCSETMFNKRR